MDYIIVLIFLVSFVASVLSGIAGGGMGFVTTPFWLVLGMSPAQGGATGAFMATGMSMSSVAAFRNSDHFPKDKKLLALLLGVTIVASVLGALVVPLVDIQTFKYVLAAITLCALPLLFLKPHTTHYMKKYRRTGLLLAAFFMAVGSIITSSAFSILFTLSVVFFLGQTVLQTTALKRILFFVQSIVLLVGFTVQGFLVWEYAIAGFFGGALGAYIGTRYAIKKGEHFAKYALVVMAVVGAVALLV